MHAFSALFFSRGEVSPSLQSPRARRSGLFRCPLFRQPARCRRQNFACSVYRRNDSVPDLFTAHSLRSEKRIRHRARVHRVDFRCGVFHNGRNKKTRPHQSAADNLYDDRHYVFCAPCTVGQSAPVARQIPHHARLAPHRLAQKRHPLRDGISFTIRHIAAFALAGQSGHISRTDVYDFRRAYGKAPAFFARPRHRSARLAPQRIVGSVSAESY